MTQNEEILSALKQGYTLTSLEAFHRFGCVSFPKRLCELRKLGHDIRSNWRKEPTGKLIKAYYLPRMK